MEQRGSINIPHFKALNPCLEFRKQPRGSDELAGEIDYSQQRTAF
uniref:Uncharacterized protein n=1 Tax=Anguilla anguilla TaxID=7936 RepID=A0A0E9Q1P9_ANGAN